MFISDMPNIPPQNVPVMIAQANQAQPGNVSTIRTLGVCSPVPSNNYSGENGLSPIMDAQAYLRKYEHQAVNSPASITVLRQPTHGVLRLLTEADRGTLFSRSASIVDPANGVYVYLPEKGYLGKDRATVLVEIGGIKVKVEYFFQAVEGPLGNTGLEDNCSDKGPYWKISANLDANGTSTITAVDYQAAPIDTSALASILGSSILGGTSGITLNIADLAGGALGQTTGSVNSAFTSANSGLPTFSVSITLDTNAAGHHWFIDSTPGDNSEYLPTADANIWQARAGSEAAGKMDMLSVLLHEYGHVLGIEHSADQHASMATTLTPGTRRLPSADEMALMAQLVGNLLPLPPGEGRGEGTTQANSLTLALSQGEREFPNAPMAPLGGGFAALLFGRLRASRFGGVSTVFDSAQLLPTTARVY